MGGTSSGNVSRRDSQNRKGEGGDSKLPFITIRWACASEDMGTQEPLC